MSDKRELDDYQQELQRQLAEERKQWLTNYEEIKATKKELGALRRACCALPLSVRTSLHATLWKSCDNEAIDALINAWKVKP